MEEEYTSAFQRKKGYKEEYHLKSIQHRNHPCQQITEQWPSHLPHPESRLKLVKKFSTAIFIKQKALVSTVTQYLYHYFCPDRLK